MASSSTQEKENVVIVGGGAAGTLVARRLASKLNKAKYNLVLVTATPYYTHYPASIRMLVSSSGNLAEKVYIPYDNIFRQSECRVVLGKVVEIEEHLPRGRGNGSGSRGWGWLGLETGERVKFSVVVLATGCRWEGPLAFPKTMEENVGWVEDWRRRFEKAEDVVVVGGGATGVEFAGEIRDLSRTKRITIVHDQALLINDAYPDSFRKTVAKNTRRRDISIIAEDAIHNVEISDASTIRTQNGRLLVADLVVPCRGPRPNTEFIAPLANAPLTETGHVKVLPTLQLFDHPRIFAAGDIIHWDEQKQIEKYGAHAAVVVKNVLDVLKDRQPDALYRGCYESIVIANGKDGGNTYYSFWGPDIQAGDLVSSIAKARSMKVHLTESKHVKLSA